uniref:Homeobox domain-containing protein n=1 Tax=Anopheles culicifacies TaxID=139723 RepID=A0A182LXJ4_9DIPT
MESSKSFFIRDLLEQSFTTRLISDDEENSDIDIEDRSSDSETIGHFNAYITNENDTSENIHRTLLATIERESKANCNLSSTQDGHTSAIIVKSGRKPRRRRTAFTHAQLAYLERKFRTKWKRQNQLRMEQLRHQATLEKGLISVSTTVGGSVPTRHLHQQSDAAAASSLPVARSGNQCCQTSSALAVSSPFVSSNPCSFLTSAAAAIFRNVGQPWSSSSLLKRSFYRQHHDLNTNSMKVYCNYQNHRNRSFDYDRLSK